LVTGNPDWLVPAGMEERCFAVFDVGEDHMQDHAYFAAIEQQMKEGGREALFDYLLGFDLSAVNLRQIPKTAALLDRKIASLPPEKGWLLDLLRNGRLPWGCTEGNQSPCDAIFDSYVQHANQQGARRRSIETAIGSMLRKTHFRHCVGLVQPDRSGTIAFTSTTSRRSRIAASGSRS